MTGRDPDEERRSATPLELLFDFAFVIAFGRTAEELADLLADGHVGPAVVGFAFATFAVSWAWINFTWFASAYDTDDWLFRLTTLVQMVGVLILALGVPPMFESLAAREHVGNRVLVLGYVVMRVPMVLQWARAAVADPARRPSVAVFITTLLAAQAGWVAVALLDLPTTTTFALVVPLVLLELVGPLVAERVHGGTPWHPHHIAERYGLVVIIAVGEGLTGTTFALAAILEESGWSVETAVLGLAGVALTFGLWWAYDVMPSGELLAARRRRSFSWGYGHIVLFGSIIAIRGRVARGGVLPAGPELAVSGEHAADGGDPGRRVRRHVQPAVRRAQPGARPVPPGARRCLGGRRAGERGTGGRRCAAGVVPGGAGVHAVGDGRRSWACRTGRPAAASRRR